MVDAVTEQMGQHEFNAALKRKYPELYDHFLLGHSEMIDSSTVVDFIRSYPVPIIDGKDFVSYYSTLQYIIDNEDRHLWWML